MRRLKNERGTALLEAAVTIPILLLISVGIFEFGRAYQTWQVLTNAAREGARLAVTPYQIDGGPEARVRQYMQDGGLPGYGSASVVVNRGDSVNVNGTAMTATRVTIAYPFQFIVLQPVARLINPSSTTGSSLTMSVSALMRNESGS
jgi:Flp pilus assembly protein TadG